MASEVLFAEIRKLLESHGWTHRQGKGSHHVFWREGRANIVIPVHNKRVSPVYIRKVHQAIRELQARKDQA